jgi:hypothetical protein
MAEGKEVALAREIWELEQKGAELAAAAKTWKIVITAKQEELQNYLIAEGKTSTGHIDGIGIFSIARSTHPGVTQARMPLFLDFLRANGDQALIVETVPAETLKKYLRDKLEALTENFVEDVDYADQVQKTLGVEEPLPPAKLAMAVMQVHGVETFSKVGLSHRNKGR